MSTFSKKTISKTLEDLEKRQENIEYEIWALNYHMRIQPSEVYFFTPAQREYWLDQLIKQRTKENEALKKGGK